MSRRGRVLGYGLSGWLVLIGAACAGALPGLSGQLLATVFIGLGLVGVISMIFLEVGLGEERDRARQMLTFTTPHLHHPHTGATAPPAQRGPGNRPSSRHMPRLRGERRRLR